MKGEPTKDQRKTIQTSIKTIQKRLKMAKNTLRNPIKSHRFSFHLTYQPHLEVLTEGTAEWITWPDGWTVSTADAKRAAQFEHTVLIKEDGCEVLT